MERKKIAAGVTLCTHKTNQFKTSAVSVNIITPLEENVSEKALLVHLLARTNKDCATLTQMNRRLASLYGAVLSPNAMKLGEAQVLTLTLVTIDDRFALKSESILKEGIKLLMSCLFTPDITPEGFKKENLEREKRLLSERIDSENDDKIAYALKRMTEEMCCDETYSASPLGTKERISEVTGKEVFEVWKKLLLTCPVQINVTGSFDEDKLTGIIRPYFERLERKDSDIVYPHTEFISESYGTKTVTEKQKVQQGKLVIGFRAGMTYDMDNFAAIKVMTAIFGSGTFSKLFMNVREKMSLCYYCSARLISQKGIIAVQSGVETENTQKALEAIRHELDEVRQGNFTDETLEAAKLSLKEGYLSVSDSVLSIDGWFTSQCLSGDFTAPEQYIAMTDTVSREEIIVAANMVTEDTVYILESEKEAE
ncbi:MAG: insulinase family protein [Clostridia bacterium]|nr:insulinase family protein [Clostridia bacterium]